MGHCRTRYNRCLLSRGVSSIDSGADNSNDRQAHAQIFWYIVQGGGQGGGSYGGGGEEEEGVMRWGSAAADQLHVVPYF
jgi:hypothetical protein